MAYYQNIPSFTTANQYVIDFASFAITNGWTADFNGSYNTSYRRLHFHKGEAHFEMWSTSATAVSILGCTGYAAGNTPQTQPGSTGTARSFTTNAVGSPYWFVSTVGGLFFTPATAAARGPWGCFFIVQSKIGVWENGFGFCVPYLGITMLSDSCWGSPIYGQLYFNDQWSSTASDENALMGSNASAGIWIEQPNLYNAGIVPFPIVISLGFSLDGTKKVPIGFAPGVYRCRGGDIYDVGEEIIIGSDTYIILPVYALDIGDAATGDYLFKLGA